MGDTIESGKKSTTNKEMESLSLQTDRFPRDLLQRFMTGARRSELVPGRVKQENQDGDGSGDIELNLGLSLGGRFGVDKSKLVRSSSIASTLPVVRDDDALTPTPAVRYASLVRTSSLPVETEEEWRKRKELQSLRRMAAKRRRSEKQGRGVVVRSENEERSEREREEYVAAMNRVGSSAGPPFGLSNWAAGGGRQGGGGGGGGSVESQGGSGSSLSEMDSKPPLGSNCGGEASTASIQSLRERTGQDATGSSGAKVGESASRTPGAEMENPSKNRGRGKEIGVNSVEDMPCVFTKGDGPNGRRIEGILYKYGKGEEVRIMCVCHGSFLSPAEFVKHAGGTDVDHPLKHIVVNHNPTSFL